MSLGRKLRDFGNLFLRDTRASGALLCMQILPRQQLRLRDAAGWMVESCGGTVWITQEGDSRDIMLGTGERFTLDRDGKTLVSGLGEATFAVRPPEGGSGHRGPRFVPHASARTVWLNALYPETGAWNEPSSLRRAGLL